MSYKMVAWFNTWSSVNLMVKKELSWDELQQIPQVFVKAMGALFIAHFNHKCLAIISILEFYIVKPDVETVTAQLYSKCKLDKNCIIIIDHK